MQVQLAVDDGGQLLANLATVQQGNVNSLMLVVQDVSLMVRLQAEAAGSLQA